MSRSHTWFGTKSDAELVIGWLRDAGARQLNGDPLEGEWVPDGREIALHFPSLGPVEFWPSEIRVPECGDNSPRTKREILAMIRQRENPGQPQVDGDRSADAGLTLTQFREN